MNGARAAVVLVLHLAVAAASSPAAAHDGVVHADPAAAVIAADRPRRQADGSLFVSKSLQRTLGLRTRIATADATRSIVVPAEVVADPLARGDLRAPQAGRLEADAHWPLPGQRVAAGEVLAWLRPLLTKSDEARRTADLADLDQKLEAARVNAERLRIQTAANEGQVTTNNVYYEQAEIEFASVREQQRLATEALHGRVAVRAPAAGVLLDVPARAGAVVAAGEPLFEIFDTQRLWLSAVVDDQRLAAPGAVAHARLADGHERRLTLQSVEPLTAAQPGWRLRFAADAGEPPAGLLRGEVVTLRIDAAADAVADAADACVPLADSGGLIWTHAGPERFLSRHLTSCRDAPPRAAGERWVTQGAALLTQYGS